MRASGTVVIDDLHGDVYQVESPRKRFQAKRVDILIEHTTQCSETEAQGEALGSNVIR